MDRNKRCPRQGMEKGGQGVSCPASRGGSLLHSPQAQGLRLVPSRAQLRCAAHQSSGMRGSLLVARDLAAFLAAHRKGPGPCSVPGAGCLQRGRAAAACLPVSSC